MAKKTMVSYLAEELESQLADYEVGLDWDRKNHSVEIIFRLFARSISPPCRKIVRDKPGSR